MSHSTAKRCDIFCTVVDNYGDIGVCWRLARLLHEERGWTVRLWLDHLLPLVHLVPEARSDTDCQQVAGIDVCRWGEDFPAVTPANIVIEAFACQLPESYVNAMATLETQPLWLNLEYLSMEDWVPACHCRPSPHPRLPLTKYFFFPGILQGTGGVLREENLDTRRAAFDRMNVRSAFGAEENAIWISLFCYENPALPYLLDIWAAGGQPVNCLVAHGKPAEQVAAWLHADFNAGCTVQRGQLRLHSLPFEPQQSYDELLWACDLNFVRGEDSFVRAQWAALPFIWQIYPQSDEAHQAKLDAFLARYTLGMKPSDAEVLKSFSAIWNGFNMPTPQTAATAWAQLVAALPHLARHAQAWPKQLSALGSLTDNLANFCEKR